MFNEINQHPLIKNYRNKASAWSQQTYEQWRLAAEEFTELKARHGELPALIAAQAFCEGQSARKQEFYEQAVSYYKKAAEMLPEWPLAPEALGEVYRYLGKRPEAEKQLSHALKLDGKLVHARLIYAAMLCERNNYKAAEDVLKLGLKNNTTEIAFHCFLGHIALSDRRLSSAERRYQRALTLSDSSSEAYAGLSAVRIIEKRYDEALDYSKLSLHHDQRNTTALINRGIARCLTNQRKEGEADFDRVVRIAPRIAHNYFRIANFYWQYDRNLALTERYLRLAINCESYRSDYHTAMGVLYLEQNNLMDAEKYLRQAIILNPDDILALHGLGILAILGSDQKIASKYFSHATTLLFTSRRYLVAKLASQLDPRLKESAE
ncbi:MAG: tetratricopeptide repeat protein [Acidobacteria bacterium]|nr:tetratricopeptide repeat protein [Acidobacteriota bacterium]